MNNETQYFSNLKFIEQIKFELIIIFIYEKERHRRTKIK